MAILKYRTFLYVSQVTSTFQAPISCEVHKITYVSAGYLNKLVRNAHSSHWLSLSSSFHASIGP